MKPAIPIMSAVLLALGFSAQAFAQSSQPPRDPSFTHGESKRCESLSGEAKERCDREEATKTQEPEPAEGAKESSETPAAAGSSSEPSGASGTGSSAEEKTAPRTD